MRSESSRVGDGFPDAGAVRAVDRAVVEVARHQEAWRTTSPERRALLLRRCIATTADVAQAWVEADATARRVHTGSPMAGIEWMTGPMFVLRMLGLLAETMDDIALHGSPRPPGPIRVRPDGRVTVGIVPKGFDRALFPGYSAQTWVADPSAAEHLAGHLAAAYRSGSAGGGVRAILGAGNVSSLAPNDALTTLFGDNRCAVLKMSPYLAYLEDIVTAALRPLIDEGCLRVVVCGADVATHLAHDPGVDDVLLTGAASTYHALVFGMEKEAMRRKAEDRPVLDKPVVAELGSIAPVLVVPGRWSAKELRYHAENIASSLVINTGATCVTPRLVVTHRQWPLRAAFLDALRSSLDASPTRYPYYPGTVEKYDRFLESHPHAERLGTPGVEELPWLLQTDLAPDDRTEPAFAEDPFCGILFETALDVDGSASDFLAAATEFCNEHLYGTLNAVLLIDPRSRQEPAVARAFDSALANLRYGNVIVNAGPGLPYLFTAPPWGAYPGARRNAVVSGMGFVHNTYLFDNPEKTVTWAPFRARPKPPWFVSHRGQLETFRTMTTFEAAPGLRQLGKVLWHGARP